jgi:hypothetical protein
MGQALTQPAEQTPTERQAPELDRLFHEVNLLRLEGYYFCLDPKAAAKRAGRQEFLQPITTSEGRVERALAIEPHPKYGHPSTVAYRVLLAITKKLSDYGYPVAQSVSFSQRELAALSGRRSFGGKDAKDFLRAVMQLKSTEIWGSFFDKDTEEWRLVTFSILTSVIFSGRRQQIRECVFYLDPLIVRSLNSRYAFCLNFRRLEQLEPIGIALFKHLFFRFSHLESHGRFANRTYVKDYGAICAQWLGGLKPLPYRSKILQEQLGRHLEALKAVKLLRSYKLEKNKRGDGFNVTFVAGSGFLEDYRDFYRKLLQPGLPFERALDEDTVQKPLELVRHFYEQRYGPHDVDELVFSPKETSLARSLLESRSFQECKDLVEYALREARSTDFDLQHFGGVRLYAAAYAASKETRRQRKEKEAKERTEAMQARLHDEYERYRRQETDRARARLSAEELAAIERPIRQALQQEGVAPIGFELLVRLQINKALEERFPIPSFEEWQAQASRGGA